MAKDWILTPQLSKNKQSLRQENVAVKGKSSINRFELWKWEFKQQYIPGEHCLLLF